MASDILLLTGYRRTGKDFLCSTLQSKEHGHTVFAWTVYCHAQRSQKTWPKPTNPIRLAFADELKKEVNSIYQITIEDSHKDQPLFNCHRTGRPKSARDLYIEQATVRKEQDIDYWAKLVAQQLQANRDYIITDWRFPNELQYLMSQGHNVTTVRLFRPDVPIPAATDNSEHSLDNHATDFLLVPQAGTSNFRQARERFPQYQDYVVAGTI